MIIVKNRKMVIPYDDMYIGTTYDDDSERRIFRIDRYAQNERDLSALTFRLDIKQPGQQADTVILDKDIDERYIYLTWNITNSVIRAVGLMFVQIRAIDDEATVKWSTYDAALYVARHLNTPGSYTGSLTEIEQMEQDHQYMKGVVDELKSHLDYTHEAEGWAIGKKDGEDVQSTDETYHNNSKYYSEQAGSSATAAANSATAAAGSATQAAATVADTNTRFNNAVAAVTVNTEVQDARVGADGTTYTVLKNRLDAEHTDVKSAIDDITDDVYVHESVDLNSWNQGYNSPSNGSLQDGVNVCRTGAIYIKDGYTRIVWPNTYDVRILVYDSTAISSYLGRADGFVEWNDFNGHIEKYRGKYIRFNVRYTGGGVAITPSDVTGIYIINNIPTDTTLTMSGKAADAKVTGDNLFSMIDTVGRVVTADFVKPESGSAIVHFAYPVRAGRAIKFFWTSEGATSGSSLNLSSRVTVSGENVENLKLTAKVNTIYEVTPTVDANYLRVVATRSGTINVHDKGTIFDDLNGLKKDVAQLETDVSKMQTTTPFVRFAFDYQMYDPSDIFGESGEMGSISGWSSNALALSKVHAAFDALCASDGAGYGYGERVTGLYKEAESDEALFDLIAPSYITQGVTQGETVTLNIGTDTDGNPVTYSYTYESSTQPYDIRLYKFHDTNHALHNNSTDIPKKKLLLIGGVHGNEFCAPIDLYVFAKHLCTDYSNPDMYKLRSAYDVYIIPYVNGFGCQYQWNNQGHMSTGARSNGHMVDINRNCYTSGWVGPTGTAEQITAHFEAKIANLATNTFAGPSNGSEFEGQLIKSIIECLNPDVVIDHHHNSGNSPFYATAYDRTAGYVIYQSANDFACALLKNLPEYYGTKYNINQILGSDVSPATRAAANGHINTMAYELGVKMSAVNEMAQSIAYNNGVYDAATKAATKYTPVVFKVSEFSLLIELLHLCQWAMEH